MVGFPSHITRGIGLRAPLQQNLFGGMHLKLCPFAAGPKIGWRKKNSWSCPDPVSQTFVGGSHHSVELRGKRGMELHWKICNDGHAIHMQFTWPHFTKSKGHQIFQDPPSQSYKGDQDENQLPFHASSFWSVDSC